MYEFKESRVEIMCYCKYITLRAILVEDLIHMNELHMRLAAKNNPYRKD